MVGKVSCTPGTCYCWADERISTRLEMIVEAEAEEVEVVGKAFSTEAGYTVKVSCSGFSFDVDTTDFIFIVGGLVDETDAKKVDVEVGREMVAETVVDTRNSSD